MRTRHSSRRARARRGTILPLVALLMTVLMGLLAITYDLGRVAVVRTQLQNEADAAALAAASALGTDNLLVTSPNQATDYTSARDRAKTFAQANLLDLNGSRSAVLDSTNDVTFGLLTTPTTLSQGLTTTTGATAFNSVQVNAHADATHGGKLSYVFAKALGFASTDVQATATATVQLYTIKTLQSLSSYYSPILPITMSKTDWQAMYGGTTAPDNYKYDPVTNTISAGSDGLKEQQLYPGSNGTSSNNGLIQFGTTSHSNSVLQGQILNGMTATDMTNQWPTTNGAPPWNAAGTFTIGADPGWRANTFDDLATVATSGRPRLIPINDGTSPGNGANGTYTIVAFAPVRIVYSNKGGKSGGYALVQPAVMTGDPTVVASTTLATAGQGGVPVVHLTR